MCPVHPFTHGIRVCVLHLVAAGTMGLKGNLSCGEIVEQLVHALRVTPIRNIVFMVRETYLAGQAAWDWTADGLISGAHLRGPGSCTTGQGIPGVCALALPCFVCCSMVLCAGHG